MRSLTARPWRRRSSAPWRPGRRRSVEHGAATTARDGHAHQLGPAPGGDARRRGARRSGGRRRPAARSPRRARRRGPTARGARRTGRRARPACPARSVASRSGDAVPARGDADAAVPEARPAHVGAGRPDLGRRARRGRPRTRCASRWPASRSGASRRRTRSASTSTSNRRTAPSGSVAVTSARSMPPAPEHHGLRPLSRQPRPSGRARSCSGRAAHTPAARRPAVVGAELVEDRQRVEVTLGEAGQRAVGGAELGERAQALDGEAAHPVPGSVPGSSGAAATRRPWPPVVVVEGQSAASTVDRYPPRGCPRPRTPRRGDGTSARSTFAGRAAGQWSEGMPRRTTIARPVVRPRPTTTSRQRRRVGPTVPITTVVVAVPARDEEATVRALPPLDRPGGARRGRRRRRRRRRRRLLPRRHRSCRPRGADVRTCTIVVEGTWRAPAPARAAAVAAGLAACAARRRGVAGEHRCRLRRRRRLAGRAAPPCRRGPRGTAGIVRLDRRPGAPAGRVRGHLRRSARRRIATSTRPTSGCRPAPTSPSTAGHRTPWSARTTTCGVGCAGRARRPASRRRRRHDLGAHPQPGHRRVRVGAGPPRRRRPAVAVRSA